MNERKQKIEYQCFLKFLSRKGLNEELIKQVLPNKFNGDFEKSLAATYLRAIKCQDPKYYAGLKSNLSVSYRKQNFALMKYLINSKSRKLHGYGLALYLFISSSLPDIVHSYDQANSFGLVDCELRNNWQRDAIAIMSEIQDYGWVVAYSKFYKKLYSMERRTLNAFLAYKRSNFISCFNGKRRAKKKAYNKLNSKRKSLTETCNKISVLAPLFQGYKTRFVGTEPFHHERHWERRVTRWNQSHHLHFPEG